MVLFRGDVNVSVETTGSGRYTRSTRLLYVLQPLTGANIALADSFDTIVMLLQSEYTK